MKKILGIVLSAAMLISSLPANAETQTKKYSGDSSIVPKYFPVSYETNNTVWDESKEYIGVNTYGGEFARTGNNSLCINITSPHESNRFIKMARGIIVEGNNSTYRLSFWIKGEMSTISTAFNDWKYKSSQYTKGDTIDGWTNYYRDITIADESTNGWWISLFFEHETNMLIDDISVKKITADGDKVTFGNELITDPSFEETVTSFNDRNKGKALGIEINSNINNDAHSEFLSGDYVHSGNSALRLKRESESHTWGNVTVMNEFDASDFEENGTYMAEFWIKGTYNTGAQNMRIGLQGGETYTTFQSCSKVDYENGWTKYQGQIDYNSNDSQDIKNCHKAYVLVGQVCDLAIDDIKIYNTSKPNVNLFTNGDFERGYFLTSPANEFKSKGWLVNASDVAVANGFGTTSYIEATDKEKYSGKYSMNVHYIVDGYINDCNVLLSKAIGQQPAGTYKIEFAAKGVFEEGGCLITVLNSDNWGDRVWLSDSNWTKTDLGNGWTKYTIEQNRTIAPNTLQFCFTRAAYDLYIDDISVVNVDNPNVNLLNNGGFEDTKNTTQITDIMVYPTVAENSANVVWTNPASDVSSIKVYFNDEDMNVNASLESEAHNEIFVSGLENNKDYNVKIVATIDNKEYITEIPYTAKNYGAQYAYAKNWLATRSDSTSGYANTIFSLDSTDKQSGNYSAKIESLMTNAKDNVYVTLAQNVNGLSTATLYKVKLKAKTTDDSSHLYLIYESEFPGENNTKTHIFKSVELTKDADLADGWKSYSAPLDDVYDYMNDERTYSVVLRPAINKLNGSMWIDDVELYATDDTTGNVIGNNLVKNSGFDVFEAFEGETSFTDAAGEKVNTVKPGEITATTSIKNNAKGDNFKATVIYALYKNGSLDKIETVEKVMSQVSYEVPADSFTQTFTIPDDGNEYSIKVMYWNGLESLIPIAEVDKI